MIILLIVIIGLVSYSAFSKPELKSKLMFNAYKAYHSKEYYRLLSSGFIHGDWYHFGFNMYAFYIFGDTLLRSFAVRGIPYAEAMVLVLFLLGVTVSSIPSLMKHKDNFYYNSLGASGGVSSIIFASIMFNPIDPRIGLIFLPKIPAFLFGGLYLLYSNYQAKKGNDNIGHDAHIFGGLFGLVFIAIIYPNAIGDFIEQIMNWDGAIF